MDAASVLQQRVLSRLQQDNAPDTIAELWRSMRNTKALESSEGLRQVLEELADRDCLRLLPQTATGAGRPRADRIELHPQLRDPGGHPPNPLKESRSPPEGTLVDIVDMDPGPEAQTAGSDPFAVMQEIHT